MAPDQTNAEALARWNEFPRQAMVDMDADGDPAKRWLLNAHVLRLLGEVAGRRVLDAGCGNGYFSRMLAARGATVLGVDGARRLVDYARQRETELSQGIEYETVDLSQPSRWDAEFDAVVCNMVLMAVPDWRRALRTCAEAVRSGGLLVLSIVHPAFERLAPVWREHGEYRLDRYLDEYEIPGRYGSDFHRPLSDYLNALAATGFRLREVVEPRLDEATAAEADLESYRRLPNFLILAAEAPVSR